MVGHLAWLKSRLLWNGLRTDPQRRVGFPVAVVALGAAAWYLADRYREAMSDLSPTAGRSFALWGALAVFSVWVTLPVVIFPLDENLDPAQFALAPIDRWKLVTGLAVAALIAPSVVVLVLLLGTNVVVLGAAATVPAAMAASLLLGVQMVVGGQLFSTAVSAVLRSRRGRDLAVFIIMGIGLSGFAAQALVAATVGELGLEQAVLAYSLDGAAVLLPPVAAQNVAVAIAGGEPVEAAVSGLVALAWIVGMAWGWMRLLDWMLTTPTESPRPNRAARSRGMAGRAWGTRKVLARKELRFYLRDPRQRLVWTGAVIFVGLAAASILVGTGSLAVFRRQDWLPLVAPALVLFVGLPIALNQFGWERNAASYLFVLPVPPRSLLLGKNLATFAALMAETTFLAVALAALSGGWSTLWLVPPLAVCSAALQLAVGNVVSVVTPLRLPREGTDVFAQATEQGCLAIASQVVSFFAIGMLMVPPASVAVLTVAFGEVVSPWVAAAFAVAWGAVFYLASIWLAGLLLRRRLPEVVQWVQVS